MRIFDSCKSEKILVIGDLMLDYYYHGSVSRISPEAPVPVVKLEKEDYRAGGAANVCVNLATLGATTFVCGVVGNDYYGRKLIELLNSNQIDTNGIVTSDDYNTMVKKRVIGNKQQIARLDFNDDEKPIPDDMKKLKNNIDKYLPKVKVLIISDYNKGVCIEEITQYAVQKANDLGIITIVDPKNKIWTKYKDADYITPNFVEYSEALNFKIENINKDIENTSKKLLKKYGIKNILLTRSEKGVSLINNNSIVHFSESAKEVFDVSGAGDTVNATFGYLIANDFSQEECARLANIAGTIVVGKAGTATVTLEEIELYINNKEIKNDLRSKVYTLNELGTLIKIWRDNNESIAFTNGCFDIIHRGHITSLYESSKFANHLIVGLNSDRSVKALKGEKRPIVNENDRAFVLSAFDFIDAIIIFDEDTPENILKYIKPDVLLKGGDYKKEDIAGRQYANRVELINFVDGYSSTEIIDKF
jgi:bifunctional protein rfaE, domain I